ncbi:hypothetical protein B0T16DRAFT_459044 [Cercophora newfieldiana]|uniref:Uncharacterized protein n=1 Tax=Cercophora newfieldiana TaxID=92897 RepID=A0AA39Y6Y5_9PEZI|nr:hypothetical protein B0T16DRAFT_459044 [Cercophora newfieldiana]
MKTGTALAFLCLFFSPSHASINWDIFEHGVVKTFKWTRSFPDDGSEPGGFDVHCRVSGNFHAKMYRLSDLPFDPPSGLSPWHDGIEDFLGHLDYMGSWDGVDHKGQDREIVVMEYVDVPEPVRHWIEEQQADEREDNKKKWYFGVFEKPKKEGDKIHTTVKPRPTTSPSPGANDPPAIPDKDKIVVFPAASVYEVLPLWVSKRSSCERALSNLAKYKPQAEDDAILAWVMDHSKPDRALGKRDMRFRIEALSVTETEDGKRTRLMWEKLHRTVRRNERKIQKEERLKAREELKSGRGLKDEL